MPEMMHIYIAIAFLAAIALYPSLLTLLGKKRQVDWPLTLRKLQSKGDKMCAGQSNHNVFAQEFNALFLATVHILDYAVMKYVHDCRLLAKQEQAHARMHMEGIKAQPSGFNRFTLLAKLFNILLLRLGQPFGLASTLAVETVAGPCFHTIGKSRFMKDWETDLTLFHMFEEVEHGPLTVQSLKKQSSFLMRLLTYFPMVGLTIVFFLLPPFLKLVSSPLLFFRQPSAFIDLLYFYAAFLPAFFRANWLLLAYYLSPVAVEREEEITKAFDYFKQRVSQRGIAVDDVDSESYALRC